MADEDFEKKPRRSSTNIAPPSSTSGRGYSAVKSSESCSNLEVISSHQSPKRSSRTGSPNCSPRRSPRDIPTDASSNFFSEHRLSQLFDVDSWIEEESLNGLDDDNGREPPPEPAPRSSYCPPSPPTSHYAAVARQLNPYQNPELHYPTLFVDPDMYPELSPSDGSDTRFSGEYNTAEYNRLSTLSNQSSRYHSVFPKSDQQDHSDESPDQNQHLELNQRGAPLQSNDKVRKTSERQLSSTNNDSNGLNSSNKGAMSLPSLLSELGQDLDDEVWLEDDATDGREIEHQKMDWHNRCLDLEMSLQSYKDHAGKVRNMLQDKLSTLELRVVEAENRADDAEEKVRQMEDRLAWNSTSTTPLPAIPPHSSTGESSPHHPPSPRVHHHHHHHGGVGGGAPPSSSPSEVISTLSSQVDQERQLRMQDARKVEAKAAKIKEWVTNKLRELEVQNAVLREQNAKCNVQLELLRGRLAQLSTMHTHDQQLKWKRRSLSLPKDSSNGFGSSECVVGSTGPEHSSMYLMHRPSTLGRDRRSKSRSPNSIRRASSSDTDANYNDPNRNNNTVPHLNNHRPHHSPHLHGSPLHGINSSPQHLPLAPHSSPLHTASPHLHLNGRNSPASLRLSNVSDQSNKNRRTRDSRVDSGSVDLETPQSMSPKSPLEAMLNSLTQSTGSLSLTHSSNSSLPRNRDGESPRKPIPQPRTKHGLCTPTPSSPHLHHLSHPQSLSHSADSLNNVEKTVEINDGHEYSEIYTPSKEWPPLGEVEKPPTPPLHRFPSWESRIYQVAQEGLSRNSGVCNGEGGSLGTHRGSSRLSSGLGAYPEIHVPVYAAVKGRASQIRSIPFTGDSSDSSDNEEGGGSSGGGVISSSHPPATPSSSSSSSSPSKSKTSASLSPAKLSGSSPSRSIKREPSQSTMPDDCRLSVACSDISFESGLSDDYAIPPDARSDRLSCGGSTLPPMSTRSSCIDHQLTCTLSTTTPPRTSSAELTNVANSTHSLANTMCGGSMASMGGGMTSPRPDTLEKSGYLTKLGGKLKTWRKRYFVLKDGTLSYWKSQSDVTRNKAAGEIMLDSNVRVLRTDGSQTFEVNTGKKTYYLTADSTFTVEEWVRTLQNVIRRQATRLLLSREDQPPTLQGWLTKVKHGHPKRCWCVLLQKTFVYFKTPNEQTPLGQINMREARVEEVERVSDSEGDETPSDEFGGGQEDLTIAIFPNNQGPTYLIMPTKQDKDQWLYHLTVVSGGGSTIGTQYEQLVHKLMELDGDPNCVLWRHPLLLHTKDALSSPLTSLNTSEIQAEAIKLFKSMSLYTSVLLDASGIDYHVVLCQNALQQCLDMPELQPELFCGLIKQTSKHLQAKAGVQVTKTLNKIKHSRNLLLCATQSLFLCDSSGAQKASPTLGNAQQMPADPKINPPSFTFLQGWQFLALAVSLFVPKNSKLLWYLKLHLQRNVDPKTEQGKYAAYCQRSLNRTLELGGREAKPSRMEVLSILLKNPFQHSLPHAIPVHFLNGTYQVVGFDGSTTIEEFMSSLNHEIGCRDSHSSGFALFSDDPIEKDLEHCLNNSAKLCDVISKWETALREKGSGKFENTKVIRLLFKSRLYWRSSSKHESDKEKLLLCYQSIEQIQQGRFPLTKDLAMELTALMAQIDMAEVNSERSRGSGSCGPSASHIMTAYTKFYPPRFQEGKPDQSVLDCLQEKWIGLRGRSQAECVRICLTCLRKWPYFGAALFPAAMPALPPISSGVTPIGAADSGSSTPMWVAVSEDAISLLEHSNMNPIARYTYNSVVTFGGCQEDFMLVVHTREEEQGITGTHKLLLSMTKPKILELTLLIADYMNALGRTLPPGTPQPPGSLTRHGSRRSTRAQAPPDLLKMTCEVENNRKKSRNVVSDATSSSNV